MIDARDRSDVGALARARRFLGRVLDTVRGSEPPTELVPEAPPRSRDHALAPAARATEASLAQPLAPMAATSSSAAIEPHTETSGPRASSSVALVLRDPEPRETLEERVTIPEPLASHEPARALLDEGSWSGLRCEEREGLSWIAWRGVDPSAALLRTIEIRCALGALDASPEVVVQDRPVHAALGATSLTTDALRVLVALGSMREGEFVSVAHAQLR
ncbi:MAG: hypothetical protein U0353_00155 [Sandaracinus sp.]